jgi:predicted N-acetyltransferase YhbS
MSKRIYNTTKSGDSDDALNSTFRFAGKDAYYRHFGFGKWYGSSIATVAVSRDGNVVVVAWQAGYIKGSDTVVEGEIDEFVSK